MCVVQYVSWLVNVRVLGPPRLWTIMEKVNCGFHAQWTGSGEAQTRRLGSRDQRLENRLCGSHWVSEEQGYMGDGDDVDDQVKEEDDGDVALDGGQTSTLAMKMTSFKSRRKVKKSSFAKVGHVLTSVSHDWLRSV